MREKEVPENTTKTPKRPIDYMTKPTFVGFLFLGGILILDVIFSVNRLQSSWYALQFFSNGVISAQGIIIVGLDAIRWLMFIVILLSIATLAVFILLPENNNIIRLGVYIIRGLIVSILVLIPIIGLNNFVLYNAIGWNYLSPAKIFEGMTVLLAFVAVALIALGIQFRLRQKNTLFFENLFNIAFTLLPVLFFIFSSIGKSTHFPSSLIISTILLSLFGFLVGIDELRGSPTLYNTIITNFLDLEKYITTTSTASAIKTSALAQVLKAFSRLTPDEQKQISQFIIETTKPTFSHRLWSIFRIVISTAALAILVEEPVSIFVKWVLKTLFNYSY